MLDLGSEFLAVARFSFSLVHPEVLSRELRSPFLFLFQVVVPGWVMEDHAFLTKEKARPSCFLALRHPFFFFRADFPTLFLPLQIASRTFCWGRREGQTVLRDRQASG